MEVVLLFLTLFVITVFFRKIILHYKLLRINKEGKLNPNEDYFLTYMFTNKHFDLKIKCNTVGLLVEYYADEDRIQLKNRINKTLRLFYSGLIALLVAIVFYQLM
ncbi:hypothetical protein [Fulvivirga lutea]|uniref:Uncharacterized protein n=1 Tax=Fulvivirga lutea TaxID=2810512 RepID=A0A975A142_9BACT|nr:hypothetical protein [Fulvivirga lutea]QSE98034.1 hypothetical protein JR347_02835 [Fulvivirga lutea]